MLNPGEYQVLARAEGYSSVSRLCVVGFDQGATICNFELSKSNWDRIKQIMALHGNKPIRLLNPGGGNHHANHIPNGNGDRLSQRRDRLMRRRRLRQQRLLARMTTTTTPAPTTTTTPATTTTPPATESPTSWYDYDLPEITDSDYGFNWSVDDIE